MFASGSLSTGFWYHKSLQMDGWMDGSCWFRTTQSFGAFEDEWPPVVVSAQELWIATGDDPDS